MGKLDICHYSLGKVPCVSINESWSHRSIMPNIKTVKPLRTTRGEGFEARRFSNYNRGKGYVRTSVACQTDSFRDKKIYQGREQWGQLTRQRGSGASNKPNG